MSITDKIKRAWNAFNDPSTPPLFGEAYVAENSHRTRRLFQNDRSMVSAIYTRISIDAAAIDIRHIELDDSGRFAKDADSELNKALTLETNLDQAPRAFRQDIYMTLFDKGVAAIVPVDTSVDPNTNEVFDVYSLRVGEIVSWYPNHVKVSVYNEKVGRRKEVLLEKRFVSIIENPLYSVMNEPNSTLQRLIRKLSLLDLVDEQSSSGKLDLIIQLPYVIKSEARRQQAENRRSEIEFQLKNSKYGIAYTDGTERITQLNRPVENNLLKTVEYLTTLLYSQLGLTASIMNGTASEQEMLNYYNRTVEPVVQAVVEGMQSALLSPTRTAKKERIKFYRDPFKLVPVSSLAEISDKFTRNEILTANEVRGFMGIAPATDPKADELVNSNMPQPPQQSGIPVEEMDRIMSEVLDGLSGEIDSIMAGGADAE